MITQYNRMMTLNYNDISENAYSNNDNYLHMPLQWRHNEHDGISDHQPHECLHNRLFRRVSKKTSKPRVIGLSPVTGEFLEQRVSNAENVSIWWRHHDTITRQKPNYTSWHM